MKLQVTRNTASAAFVLLAMCLLVGCAADRVRDDAEQLMAQGDYEHAVQALEVGTTRYPDSVQLRSRLVLARAQAQSQLIEQARAAQTTGDIDRAETLLRRATAFDGSSQRAAVLLADLQVARSQHEVLQRANTLAGNGQTDAALRLVNQALRDNRRDPGLLALQHRLLLDQRQAQVRATQQSLAETRPITLDFRDANVRNVLDVLSRNSGINFVLDKDVKDQRVTVYAKSVRLEDGLDMVLNTSQLARKVLDSKTVLIYPNTPDKQREHQEQLVKVFYLANGDAKGAAAFLKSMMKLREPYVDEHGSMLAMRDSLENIQLAERLIALFDNPEPEVLLEAEVLEVSADRLTELGVSLPTQVTLTPLTLAGGTNLTLDSFPLHRGNIGVGLPAATINAKRTIGDVNTLANPKIRTRSGEKAKVMIGDKIPVITTTTTPGVSGFVSETVSYQDVGIKLEVEPKVYPDDDVSIRLNLEVSALGTQTKTASGTIAYQISTRNASTLLQLHDGETQLLAGLISSDERASTAGLPGLADVPLLGRLFSDQTNSHSKTELVLSITPHIVRGQPHLDAAESEAWVGTEMYQRLKPVGGRFDNEAPASTAAPRATPAATQPGSTPGGTARAASQNPPDHVSAGSPAAIAWSGPVSVKVGEVFATQLQIRTGVPIGSMALSLQYPSDLLGLVGFAEAQDMPEAAASGSPAAHNEPGGKGVIDLERVVANPSDAPLSLVRVQFKALKEGKGNLEVIVKPADPTVNVTAPPSLALKVEP